MLMMGNRATDRLERLRICVEQIARVRSLLPSANLRRRLGVKVRLRRQRVAGEIESVPQIVAVARSVRTRLRTGHLLQLTPLAAYAPVIPFNLPEEERAYAVLGVGFKKGAGAPFCIDAAALAHVERRIRPGRLSEVLDRAADAAVTPSTSTTSAGCRSWCIASRSAAGVSKDRRPGHSIAASRAPTVHDRRFIPIPPLCQNPSVRPAPRPR